MNGKTWILGLLCVAYVSSAHAEDNVNVTSSPILETTLSEVSVSSTENPEPEVPVSTSTVASTIEETPPDLPTDDEWPECDSKFMEGQYSIVHPQYCDRFFACEHGVPYLMQCEDGFGYLPFRGCKLLHLVDCKGRPKLQKPRGNKDCPRLYGLFSDPRGCGRYFKCINGTAVEDRCANTLMFDNDEKVCREMTKEETDACKEPSLLGCVETGGDSLQACTWFQCPAGDILPFGDHSRHPFPGNCHHFIICFKDGSIKIGGCDKGMAFDPVLSTCEPEQTVQSCSQTVYINLLFN